MTTPETPLMRQYYGIKQQVPNALLLFRLGDFYELFYDDAVTAARELEITLTSRNKEKGQPIPMCGVPYHASEGYIARLIQKGYRVAICDQMEEASAGKKLVRREVTRIVTPGTAMNAGVLRSHENNYLAAVFVHAARAALAHVDLSTGEFRATEIEASEIGAALETLNAKEALAPTGSPLKLPCLKTDVEPWVFGADYASRSLCDHFHLLSLDGCGLENRPLATAASAALLYYLRETQRAALDHLERPAFYDRADALVLDAATVRNLELVEPLFAGESKESTLLYVLDRTRTGMGGRLLRRRLLAPSIAMAEIDERLDAVAELHAAPMLRSAIAAELGSILDLERLLSRLALSTAGPRDLAALARSLAVIPALKGHLRSATSQRLKTLDLDEVAGVRDSVLAALADEPPVNLSDLGVIRDGYDSRLDELRDISKNSKTYLAQVEQRERTRTNIASLKVRFNNVFGYYIEISKANLHLAPPDYERKQTLVNAERFTTPELKEYERKVLDADERILEIERRLYREIRESIAARASRLRQTSFAIAQLDALANFARLAAERNYSRPSFTESEPGRACNGAGRGELLIAGGRHTVIEALLETRGERFVPNDLYLDDTSQPILIITGPNMGGKSTYLRQAALIVVMAQIGAFVPATEARLPLVDRIFTRIGASDNLARGRSTFLVEMSEVAAILNTATGASLILLDEVGRGTSTFDGLSIAWAVVEYLHENARPRTLFATHYHELTELERLLPGVKNVHVSVREAGSEIIFLRRVEPGAADKSYGIEVARLAGLPAPVIERAREILAEHEKSEHKLTEELSPGAALPPQPVMFAAVDQEVLDALRRADLDNLKPLEALNLLDALKKQLS